MVVNAAARSDPQRSRKVVLLLVGGVVAAGLGVLFFFNPGTSGFYPVCLFYLSTGLMCPGCGSLRAIHQLLHGHFAAAFHYNALLVSSLPLAGWMLARFGMAGLNQRPMPVIRAWWLWTGLIVLVMFGVLRNVL
jgi:hypothetical protein